MTIMNGRIRAELTDLLADHLALKVGGCQNWHQIADEAMDFIYGGEDGNLQEPEFPQAKAGTGDQGDPDRPACCNGFTCGCCPGNVDRLDGGPISSGDIVLGVMTQEPLRASFVYLGPPSRPEEFVRLRESGSGQTLQSPQGSGSADA